MDTQNVKVFIGVLRKGKDKHYKWTQIYQWKQIYRSVQLYVIVFVFQTQIFAKWSKGFHFTIWIYILGIAILLILAWVMCDGGPMLIKWPRISSTFYLSPSVVSTGFRRWGWVPGAMGGGSFLHRRNKKCSVFQTRKVSKNFSKAMKKV